MKKWLALSEGKYKKPILRVGEFQKSTDGTKFSFTQEHLNYFASAFSNRIPVPSEHTTDPDKNRGWVTDIEVDGDILYGVFEFSDFVKDPNIYDTSVYIPIEEGRVQPIEHVALTSYPVVDGLGKFESIACSLVPINEEKNIVAVNWANLRTTLELSEDLTEENVVDVLTARFKSLSEEVNSLKLSNTELKKQIPPVITVEQVKQKHGKLIDLAKSARKTKIEALPLSKAVQDKLVELYCSDGSIALALSENDTADTFDAVVSALAENSLLELGERTNIQTGIQLSDPSKSEQKKNGLVANAEKRKEAFDMAKIVRNI